MVAFPRNVKPHAGTTAKQHFHRQSALDFIENLSYHPTILLNHRVVAPVAPTKPVTPAQ